MRVLIVGDSPHLKTGFGRVNMIAAKEMQRVGWEVFSLGGLSETVPDDTQGITTFPIKKGPDLLGVGQIYDTVMDVKPDVVYMTADIGSVVHMTMGTPDMPAFCYIPIEGEPITNKLWKAVAANMHWLSVSKYGADLVKRQLNRDVDWAWHGVDHDVFKVTGNRDQTRAKFGWTDKFVIIDVATNVQRKQLPRLMEAVSILKHQYHYGPDRLQLYLHTVPYQNHHLEGWNLFDIVELYGIRDMVMFHPNMAKLNDFVPEHTGDPNYPGLVEIMNAADLSVNVSQVEGASLTNIEAMACGLPVMTTVYAAGMEMVGKAGQGIYVNDWTVHKSGTVYANVSPQRTAEEIRSLIRKPKRLAEMAEASLERAKLFTWDAFRSKLIPGIEKAVADYGPEKRYLIPKAKDTGSEVNEPEEPVSRSEGEDQIPSSDSGTTGSSEDTLNQVQTDGIVEAQAEGQEAPAVANTLLGALRSDAVIHHT
jgi:glycosyltransferase involved in cell wall biosynthesis